MKWLVVLPVVMIPSSFAQNDPIAGYWQRFAEVNHRLETCTGQFVGRIDESSETCRLSIASISGNSQNDHQVAVEFGLESFRAFTSDMTFYRNTLSPDPAEFVWQHRGNEIRFQMNKLGKINKLILKSALGKKTCRLN